MTKTALELMAISKCEKEMDTIEMTILWSLHMKEGHMKVSQVTVICSRRMFW
jgi:monomeric isocitrate dehydrogenase